MAAKKLTDILAVTEFANLIFAYLTLADICRLRSVCRSIRGAVHPLLYDRLDINRALRNFVHNCDGFRWNLGKADALLVGEFVLDFLSTPTKQSLVLGILVEQGSRLDDLVAYLCAEEAFERQESDSVS